MDALFTMSYEPCMCRAELNQECLNFFPFSNFLHLHLLLCSLIQDIPYYMHAVEEHTLGDHIVIILTTNDIA